MARLLYAEVSGLAGLKAQFAKIQQAVLQAAMLEVAKAGAEPVVIDARNAVPRESGDLARDIQIQPQKTALAHEGLVYVGPTLKTAWRARFIDKGVRPHEIRKKRKKVLADASSNTFFGSSVKHPGFRGIRFMQGAVERSRPRVYEIMKSEILQRIQRAVNG